MNVEAAVARLLLRVKNPKGLSRDEAISECNDLLAAKTRSARYVVGSYLEQLLYAEMWERVSYTAAKYTDSLAAVVATLRGIRESAQRAVLMWTERGDSGSSSLLDRACEAIEAKAQASIAERLGVSIEDGEEWLAKLPTDDQLHEFETALQILANRQISSAKFSQ